ncbi:MAG: PIN domain nuclease [Candidatus Limnocylindrales bacterium]
MTLLLADTSVWARSSTGEVAERFNDAIARGRVAITPVVRLEVLYMAQGTAAYDRLRTSLDALHQVPLDADVASRAEEVQSQLARRAMHHRSVGVNDLLIAAAAEVAGVTVWHYDEDYDRIAAVTGQPAEWIVARGSAP